MRILIATSHRGVVGGVETYLRALLPRLRSAGHEVAVACAFPANAGQATIDDGAPAISVRLATTPSEIAVTAADFRPDVVYTHGLPDPAADDLLASRYPAVYFAHNYAGTCVSGTKCHAFPSPKPCGRALGPGCLVRYLPRRCGGLNPITAVRLYRRERRRQNVLRRFGAVLVASRHMASELIGNGVPPERVHLVPLPATATRDPEPPARRDPSGRVLFVGRVTAPKGWSHLVAAVPRAAAKLDRRVTLIVAGDGPDRGKFERAAHSAGLPAEFLGWVGVEERERQMRAADLLVVPSLWPEPFGLVGVEAGCVGLPAAGYATGGIVDWLIPGVSGESAPGDRPDPKELAAALVRVLADDAHLQRLRLGAWETAGRFSPDAHLARLLPLLEVVARGSPG